MLVSLGHILAQCGGAIAGASVMLGLLGGDNTGDLGLGEAVLGLEFLLTFMIVLAYLRVSDAMMKIWFLVINSNVAPGD